MSSLTATISTQVGVDEPIDRGTFLDTSFIVGAPTLEDCVAELTGLSVDQVTGHEALAELWRRNENLRQMWSLESTDEISYTIEYHEQKREGAQVIQLIPNIYYREQLDELPQFSIFAKQGEGALLEGQIVYPILEESANNEKFKIAHKSLGFLENTHFVEMIRGIRLDKFLRDLVYYNESEYKDGLIKRELSVAYQDLLKALDHLKLRNAVIAEIEFDKRRTELNENYSFSEENTASKTVQRFVKLYRLLGITHWKADMDILEHSLNSIADNFSEEYAWSFDIDDPNCWISREGLYILVGRCESDYELYTKLGEKLNEDPENFIEEIRSAFGSSDKESLGKGNTIVLRPKSDALAKISNSSLAFRKGWDHGLLGLYQLISLVYRQIGNNFSEELDNEILDLVLEWDRDGRTVHRLDIFNRFGVEAQQVLPPDEAEIMKFSRAIGKVYHYVKYFELGISEGDAFLTNPKEVIGSVRRLIGSVNRMYQRYQSVFSPNISLGSTLDEVQSEGLRGAVTYSLLSMQEEVHLLARNISEKYSTIFGHDKYDLDMLSVKKDAEGMVAMLQIPLIETSLRELSHIEGRNQSSRNVLEHRSVLAHAYQLTYVLEEQPEFNFKAYGYAKAILRQFMWAAPYSLCLFFPEDTVFDDKDIVFRYENIFVRMEEMFTAFVDYATMSTGDKVDHLGQPVDVESEIKSLFRGSDINQAFEYMHKHVFYQDSINLKHSPKKREILKRYDQVIDRVETYLAQRLQDPLFNSTQPC